MHVATGLALLLWARGGPAASQDALGISPEASKFPIDDADPERSIPGEEEAARDPLQMGYLIVALTNRAQEALQQGQPARAAKYFRALGKASPGRALPFRKACAAYESAGEIASAIDMCRAALGKIDATASDRLDFLDVALKKPGELTRAELSDIDGTIARLQRELTKDKADKGRLGLVEVKCQVAARLRDRQRLSACTEELGSLKASKARLLPYAWALAMSEGDLSAAATLQDEARAAGVPAPAREAMERELAAARERRDGPLLTALRRWWPAALAALALGALALLKRKRRADLRPAS